MFYGIFSVLLKYSMFLIVMCIDMLNYCYIVMGCGKIDIYFQ